jgi:hypothetical protein
LAYCAGFHPDTIDRYMINPHDNSYIEEGYWCPSYLNLTW